MNDATAASRWDGALVTSALALTAIGVVMNYSTTAALAMGEPFPPLALRHAAGVLGALCVAFVVSRLPVAFWERFALWAWLAGGVALAATLVMGIEANGARRWLAIPGLPVALQAAEPARLATVLAVALVLSRATPRVMDTHGLLLRVGLLVAPPVLLLLLQPDFGSAVILCAVVGLLLFGAGLPFRRLALPAGLGLLGAGAYVAARPYALARVRGFLDPWQTAHGEGFQLVQSFVAFGRGGSLGVGLGDGRQKLFYLPEAHTDFILSVVAEELGLVGVLVVLGAFAALCWAGLRVARHATTPFARLLATGATGLIVLPALCNGAVVMGLLPTTGLTLPLLSHGSNSLLCTAAAIGILLRIGSDTEREAQTGSKRWRSRHA